MIYNAPLRPLGAGKGMAHLKVVYPPGVKEIFAELPEDDLARRLKECAQAFQNMNQEDDNSRYSDLALHLASEFFLDHHSKDVRLLIACCIADVFRWALSNRGFDRSVTHLHRM